MRNAALLRSAKYQQALRRYHSRGVRGQAFNVGDLVLRLVQSNKNSHKLSLPWEGPYVIVEVLRPGTYKLRTIDGESLHQCLKHRTATSLLPLIYARFLLSVSLSTPRSLVTLDRSNGKGSGLTWGANKSISIW